MSTSRIILSNADFSANNIGRYVELSEFTKKVLSKQTQFSKDSAEAVALDNFLNELTENGFIGGENPKLKYLALPCYANDRIQLYYNIASTDSDGYPINVIQSEIEELTDEQSVLNPYIQDGKIIGMGRNYNTSIVSTSDVVGRSRIDTGLYSELSIDSTMPSTTYMAYGVKGNNTPSSDFANAGLIVKEGIWGLRTYKHIFTFGGAANTNNYNVQLTNFNGTKFWGVGFDRDRATLNVVLDIDNGTAGDVTTVGTPLAASVKDHGLLTYGTTTQLPNDYTWWAASVLAVGYYISPSDMESFRTSVIKLMTALGIRK